MLARLALLLAGLALLTAQVPTTPSALGAPIASRSPDDLRWALHLVRTLAAHELSREEVAAWLGTDPRPDPTNPQLANRRLLTPRLPHFSRIVVDSLSHVSIEVAVDAELAESVVVSMPRARRSLGLERCMWDRPGTYRCHRVIQGTAHFARLWVRGDQQRVREVHVDVDYASAAIDR